MPGVMTTVPKLFVIVIVEPGADATAEDVITPVAATSVLFPARLVLYTTKSGCLGATTLPQFAVDASNENFAGYFPWPTLAPVPMFMLQSPFMDSGSARLHRQASRSSSFSAFSAYRRNHCCTYRWFDENWIRSNKVSGVEKIRCRWLQSVVV